MRSERRRVGERGRKHRLWLLPPLAIWLAAGTLGADEATLIPWPMGKAPTPAQLDELVAEETELADLERFEEFLEAAERGEDTEHMTVYQEQIDAGAFDLERLFQFGDAMFGHEFRRENGYGYEPNPRMKRVHDGHRGGRDSFSCGGCHQQGGVNGAGAATATTFYFGDGEDIASTIARNPPNVLGLGFVQKLAHEMSTNLQTERDLALAKAAETGEAVTVALSTHDVFFGELTASPDGTLDLSKLEGVDDDLVVKPFGWKGHTARLRRFTERAALVHFGIQSHVLALGHKDEPNPEKLGDGPDWWDPDDDGVGRELEEGSLTAMAAYLAMLEVPVILPPHDPHLRERWAYGAGLFEQIGCADCHRPELPLVSDLWHELPDTTGGPPLEIRLLQDGEQPRGTSVVRLFSDLKRHHMGDALADPNDDPDGIGRDVFITRPLWGLAESAPYLHDGRAATIPEAISYHGGEAQAARDLFMGLSDYDRQNIHIFLLSLTRTPRLRVPQ